MHEVLQLEGHQEARILKCGGLWVNCASCAVLFCSCLTVNSRRDIPHSFVISDVIVIIVIVRVSAGPSAWLSNPFACIIQVFSSMAVASKHMCMMDRQTLDSFERGRAHSIPC